MYTKPSIQPQAAWSHINQHAFRHGDGAQLGGTFGGRVAWGLPPKSKRPKDFVVERLSSKQSTSSNFPPCSLIDVLAANYVAEIKDRHKALSDMTDRFGNIILHTWRKKSQSTKEEIIKAACQHMVPHRWLIAHLMQETDERQHVPFHRTNVCFLTPCIDAESLKLEPALLLALLNHCIQHDPG